MVWSDLVGGFALAVFLALPFGMIASLFSLLTDKPKKYVPDSPLISSLDIQRCLVAAAIFVLVLTPMMALLFKADRQNAESWQVYARDHKCVTVDSRTRTEFHGGYPGTFRSETITEYLWRCEGGDEHWKR